MARIRHIEGPVKLSSDDRWTMIGKHEYGEDFYLNPDSEVYSDVIRVQWTRSSGLIVTLDYYVRKNEDVPEPQWEVVEKVHFYDPDQGSMQPVPKHNQHAAYPATEENFEDARQYCFTLADRRDNSHLSEWWEEVLETL